MATVRFKFRSSATFDSVNIGEQSSISIRDLKSIIVLKKHLNLSHHFDLVFSDFVSGEGFAILHQVLVLFSFDILIFYLICLRFQPLTNLLCFVLNSEYKDESVRIPTGSSVIIKRVPANSSPLRLLKF